MTATVATDVKDTSGRVVIPGRLRGDAQGDRDQGVGEQERHDRHADAQADVGRPSTASPIRSPPRSRDVNTELQGRGTNAGDVAKPAAGAAAGAVVGRVLGGSSKGAIIGGVIGGAVGAQRAVETKDRDVVLPQGTTVTLSLDQTFVAGRAEGSVA